MASLKNILNPERKRSVKLVVIPPEQASSTWEAPATHPSPGSSSEDDPGDFNTLIHIPHPDCPDSLACLPDTDGRPQHTLPVILRCAILGSPRKRLTIREIYAAMEEKYAYYRTAGATWKQSVRHHLSLNRLFERQPRPATDPGFGSYWTVNLLAPPGTKRPRKRGRPNKEAAAQPKKDDPPPEEGPSSTKPRRGRPRKDESPPPVAVSTPPIEPSIEPGQGNDDGDVNMQAYEDELVDELESSEDECESEEKLLHPFERRHSLSAASPHHASPLQLVVSPHHTSPHQNAPPHIVERLQMEMANLRRQSADAISISMRLSDQLARAQAEVSDTQAALESLESKLREETNKRMQAERTAEDAVRLRRAAEEALKSMRFPELSRLPR
ncbi:hypothetical protein DFH08DRAFT_911195 [Mycena albidolilacea]|uniref:Fork-head domain-containing protein n=1 Tax=Mycena albidolilacea TaxID=1033008 RepID=A0AAD7ALT4_9AGAR|nr:hypothetical protein DFH08DRAFT_911195 [Mycena albidolilacea]